MHARAHAQTHTHTHTRTQVGVGVAGTVLETKQTILLGDVTPAYDDYRYSYEIDSLNSKPPYPVDESLDILVITKTKMQIMGRADDLLRCERDGFAEIQKP